MSILDSKSKKMLVESMRGCVKNILKESAVLTSKQATDKSKFVSEKATYEQLLNITMNPLRESKYLPDYVLEGAVAILHRACLTGRKHIGINAITEGALKLHKETGAVITESMLDAALRSVEHGCGLKVIGGILKEAAVVMEFDAFSRQAQNLKNNFALASGDPAGITRARTQALRFFDQIGLSTADANLLKTKFLADPTGETFQSLAGKARNLAMATGSTGGRHAITQTGGNFSSLATRKGTDFFRDKIKGVGSSVRSSIPNPGLSDPGLSRQAFNAAKGGGWGKAALVGAGALAAGLGGAYLWNKKKQANAAEQQQ